MLAARGSFAWIAVWIALATLLRRYGPAPMALLVDFPLSLLCHRIPERCLWVLGEPMPLCSRCLGIWGGLSLSAALAWPAFSLPVLRVLLPVAAVLMLFEVVTQDMGLHPICHPTRVASGLLLSVPLGAAIGSMISRELGTRAPTKSSEP